MDDKKIKELGEKAGRHADLKTLEELYKLRHVTGELWQLLMNIYSFSRTRFNDKHYGAIREINEVANNWILELEKKYGIDD